MTHENTTRNHPAGSTRKLRQRKQILQISRGLLGLLGLLFSSLSNAQVKRAYIVESVQPIKAYSISTWQPLNLPDTVNLLQGKEVHTYRLECAGSKYAKATKISRRKVQVADTIHVISRSYDVYDY